MLMTFLKIYIQLWKFFPEIFTNVHCNYIVVVIIFRLKRKNMGDENVLFKEGHVVALSFLPVK